MSSDRGPGEKRASDVNRSARVRRIASLAVLVLVAWLIYSADRPDGSVDIPDTAVADNRQSAAAEAFASGTSGVMMTLEGTVTRLLPDDNDGSRHQRFIIRLADDHTVLVSHNIDLAPRAPVARDTSLRLRGQYEWNEQGGVIHWTHHDPDGDRAGGWIEIGGNRFR